MRSSMRTEYEKMEAGAWYTCLDDKLESLRMAARRAVFAHNALPPEDRQGKSAPLAGLFACYGTNCMIETPFHCAYGFNIHLGDAVYLNAGCIILDSAQVTIGSDTMIGPGAQILCAQHHKDRNKRKAGIEIAKPVSLGADVWIGAGAIIMPGVTVGDAAIVGAGAVVTRDVAPGQSVVGIPARTL